MMTILSMPKCVSYLVPLLTYSASNIVVILKSMLAVTQAQLEMVFESLGTIFYSQSIATMAASLTVST